MSNDPIKDNKKAWVSAVDMGYGHQRTAYALKSLAFKDKVIMANNYEGIPGFDRGVWKLARNFYESVSDFKKFPLLGNIAFGIIEKLKKLSVFIQKEIYQSRIFL